MRFSEEKTSRATLVLPLDVGPAIPLEVRISPFSYSALDEVAASSGGIMPAEVEKALQDRVGGEFIFTENGRHALHLILVQLGLGPDDVVSIVTTSGSSYVSNCVTRTIERICLWSLRLEQNTRAILIIHEWGRACEAIETYRDLGVPLIEDCSYAFATRCRRGELVGRRGDYALYSLPKMFAVNFGGLAVSRTGSRLQETIPKMHRDYLLSTIAIELIHLEHLCARRLAVWSAFAKLFEAVGVTPFYGLAVGDVPPVFLFTADPACLPLEDIKARFQQSGIESGIFYGFDAVYVPAHHRVGEATREFIFMVYKDLISTSHPAKAEA